LLGLLRFGEAESAVATAWGDNMTNNPKGSTLFACFLCMIGGLVSVEKPADAADLKSQPSEQLIEPAPKQWEFRFTPYAWATSVNGNSTVAGQTVDVDASFLDIVEDSESILALMGYFEARRGRLALYTMLSGAA
jgi:hypothetical protein